MNAHIVLPLLFCVVAALYSSVGNAGASAYLVVMAMFGFAPEVMRPVALVLNLFVATLATVRFYRAGWFSWDLLLPFVVSSFPAAFLAGGVHVSPALFNPLVGFVLVVAAVCLALPGPSREAVAFRRPPLPVAFAMGIAIGAIAGLTGTGGGVLLSPILILMGWADPRTAAGVAAPFILINSVFALAGDPGFVHRLPAAMPLWVAAVLVGSLVGTEWGRSRLSSVALRRVLACVLLIAAGKMIHALHG